MRYMRAFFSHPVYSPIPTLIIRCDATIRTNPNPTHTVSINEPHQLATIPHWWRWIPLSVMPLRPPHLVDLAVERSLRSGGNQGTNLTGDMTATDWLAHRVEFVSF